MIPRAHLSP